MTAPMDSPLDDPHRDPPHDPRRAGGEPAADLVPSGDASPRDIAPLPADGRQALAVVAALLDRHARDADAARAHAREIVRAVESLAKSQEFLGVQLREERARSRSLVVALCLVPLALVALGAWMWHAADGLRDGQTAAQGDVERRLAAMDGKLAEDRTAALRASFDERVKSLESDVTSARTDLVSTRSALDAEREERRKRDEATAARLAAADRDRAELEAVRAELRAASALAGAERARGDSLARALADVAKGAGREPEPVDPPAPPSIDGAAGVPGDPGSPPPSAPEPARPTPAPKAAATSVAATTVSAPAVSATDTSRVRETLNDLLSKATGPAVYRIESLAEVSGQELRGVKVTGREPQSGKVLRTIEAPTAEVVATGDGLVRLRFRDGTLTVGGRTSAFFDGRYGVVVQGDVAAWKAAALPSVRFE